MDIALAGLSESRTAHPHLPSGIIGPTEAQISEPIRAWAKLAWPVAAKLSIVCVRVCYYATIYAAGQATGKSRPSIAALFTRAYLATVHTTTRGIVDS